MARKNATRESSQQQGINDELDRQLEETFPASDPLSITRSVPSSQITPKPSADDKEQGSG